MHLLMLGVTFCWATNIVAGKEALTGFAPLALAQLRVTGAGLIYAMAFLASRRSLRLSRRAWATLFLVALNGVTLNQLFFIGGLARSTVTHTGLIVALGPVMVLVLACLMRMEALTPSKLAGMLIAFAGVGLLSAKGAPSGHGSYWLGDLILLAGSAVFAYYTILVKKVADAYDALSLNMLTFVMGAILMVPFSVSTLRGAHWTALGARAWWGLAYMVVLGTVVPYMLFAIALTGLAASRVAAFSYLQPIIAMALGLWLLSEKLTWNVVIGGTLILAGVYLTERQRGEENSAGSADAAAA